MFTAGLAASGVVHQVGWLVTSPEPWVDGIGGARSAAMRARSMNNLKQVGLAASRFNGREDAYPPGFTVGEFGVLLHGWQGLLAPFNEVPQAGEIDFSRPWDDPVNLPIFRQVVSDYLHPGIRETHDAAGLPLSHYEGNTRVLGGPRRFREKDVADGLSNTIYSGEVSGAFRPWGRPGPGRDPADGINRDPARGFGGPSPGGVNVLFMDGSVRFLKNTVNPAVLKALSTPAGQETVSPDDY
jgi:prepilin-type processing-associated H-X9-DG protein